MAFDERGHVGCAAVADLYCAPVEDFVQIAACWEMFGDQTQEFFANFGFHIFAVGGVVPCDSPLACSPFAFCCLGRFLLLA